MKIKKILVGAVFFLVVCFCGFFVLKQYTHTRFFAPLHRYEFDRSLAVHLLGESFVSQYQPDQYIRNLAKQLIERRKKEWKVHKDSRIPKILHQIWPFETDIPDDFNRTSLLLKMQHPSFVHKLWYPTDFGPMLTVAFGEEWKKLSPELIRDLAAAVILLQEGGTVVDLESECVQPVTGLLSFADCIVGFEPPLEKPRFQRRIFLSSALVAAVPNHQFINAWFQKMAFRAKLSLEDPTIDPLFITQESLTSILETDVHNYEGLLLLGPTYFVPINPSHIKKARQQWDGLKKRSLLEKCLQVLHIKTPVPFSTIDESTICVHMHGGRQSGKSFQESI